METHYCIRQRGEDVVITLKPYSSMVCSYCSSVIPNLIMSTEDYNKLKNKEYTIQEFFQNFPYGENKDLRTYILQKYNIDIWNL